MIINLPETIQKNLGYSSLKKVDPNTQEIKDYRKMPVEQRLAQAAVPAVLAAMIKYADSPKGSHILEDQCENCFNEIYAEKQDEAVGVVADYAGVDKSTAEAEMRKICNEAVVILRSQVKKGDLEYDPATYAENLRTFMNAQRHNVLAHLPGALNMGYILNEETFDDRTNKMEGPVSGFLHRIEDII